MHHSPPTHQHEHQIWIPPTERALPSTTEPPHKDELSLSSEQDAILTSRIAQINAHSAKLKATLDELWACTLFSGETLAKQRCPPRRFEDLLVRSGIATDTDSLQHWMEYYYSHTLHAQHQDKKQRTIDFSTFEKILCQIALELNETRHNVPNGGDIIAALTALVEDNLEPFLKRFRAYHNQNAEEKECVTFLSRTNLSHNHQQGSSEDQIQRDKQNHFFEDLEIDHLLMVYAAPLKRLFNHYRVLPTNPSSAAMHNQLTAEQIQLLDTMIETSQWVEFAKDLELFPKHISYVRLAALMQVACFGKVVRRVKGPWVHGGSGVGQRRKSQSSEPHHHGSSAQHDQQQRTTEVLVNEATSTTGSRKGLRRTKSIVYAHGDVELVSAHELNVSHEYTRNPEEQAAAELKNVHVSGTASSHEFGSQVSHPEGDRVVRNPLYVPKLPPQFEHDEPLLDLNRFYAALIHLAQLLFNRPEYHLRLPTVASRLEALFDHIKQAYKTILNTTANFDDEAKIDFQQNAHVVPKLMHHGTQSGAIEPFHIVPQEGGVVLTIRGQNFIQPGGRGGTSVLVKFIPCNRSYMSGPLVADRFAPPNQVAICRCSEVTNDFVKVVVPPKQTPKRHRVLGGWETIPSQEDPQTTRNIFRIYALSEANVALECSTNGVDFSNTNPLQVVTYQDQEAVLRRVVSEPVLDYLRELFQYAASAKELRSDRQDVYDISTDSITLLGFEFVAGKVYSAPSEILARQKKQEEEGNKEDQAPSTAAQWAKKKAVSTAERKVRTCFYDKAAVIGHHMEMRLDFPKCVLALAQWAFDEATERNEIQNQNLGLPPQQQQQTIDWFHLFEDSVTNAAAAARQQQQEGATN